MIGVAYLFKLMAVQFKCKPRAMLLIFPPSSVTIWPGYSAGTAWMEFNIINTLQNGGGTMVGAAAAGPHTEIIRGIILTPNPALSILYS